MKKAKISKLEIGAVIEDGKNKKFITEMEGPSLSTIQRVKSGAIVQTAYLITQENGTGPKFLSSYASEVIRQGDKNYEKLNKKLIDWEKSVVA
ncbi:MAG: hypothetical protein PHH54_07165 [Candidatus Nanoarchaeia archaeon]|nr:hypothetical protein [Candidatus Nanoarchaeia archaeon]MDD5741735.1 hypothetical protein [Candidatus Nanoarchaeia archaeon]